jgi:hypothetical protein
MSDIEPIAVHDVHVFADLLKHKFEAIEHPAAAFFTLSATDMLMNAVETHTGTVWGYVKSGIFAAQPHSAAVETLDLSTVRLDHQLDATHISEVELKMADLTFRTHQQVTEVLLLAPFECVDHLFHCGLELVNQRPVENTGAAETVFVPLILNRHTWQSTLQHAYNA